MGLGISEFLPFIIYGVSLIIVVLIFLYGCEIGIVFIASLLPIYAVVNKALQLDLPLANDIIDLIIGAMILATLFRLAKSPDSDIRPSPMLFPIAVLFGYTLLSYFVGNSFLGIGDLFNLEDSRLKLIKNYMIMPVLYLITYYNFSDRKWKYALFIFLFISFLAADLKFRESFQWVQHTHYMEKSRIPGTLGFLGPNEWGSLHSIYTLFVFGLFVVDKQIWRRIGYVIIILANSYCLLYSFSRGAYVSFLAGLLFIGIVRSRKLIVLLLALLLCWEFIVPFSVVERIKGTYEIQQERTDTVTVGDTELVTAGRTQLWTMALEHFFKNPILGTGFNTYSKLTGWDTHNVYLKTMAEQGIIGLLIYLGLYFMALKSGWRLYRNADEQLLKAFGFGFLAAVVGSIISNLFGDRWIYLQIGGLYWIFWALVDQENGRIDLNNEKKKDSKEIKNKRSSFIADALKGFHWKRNIGQILRVS